MFKRITIALFALLIVLIGALFLLPGLVPTDTYRERLEDDLSRVFARDVAIQGDIKISTFPVLKVETGSVSLSNPEGFSEGRFVDVESMTAKIRLLPLLQKRVEIAGVTLNSPTITLEKRADGRANWMNPETEPTDESGPFKRDGRFTEYEPSLALLTLDNGNLTFSDAATKQKFEVKDINLDLRAPSLERPMEANGNLVFDGLRTTIDARLNTPAAFLRGLETGFDAEIDTSEGKITVDGQFLQSEDLSLSASFDLNSESPNALAIRLPLPDERELPELSSVAAQGTVNFNPETLAFPKIEAAMEGTGIDASFVGNVDLGDGKKSTGRFTAKLDEMSLVEPYLQEPTDLLNIVSSVAATGNVTWVGSNFNLSDVETTLVGPDLSARYNGNVAFDEALALTGEFEANAGDLAALVKSTGLSQPDAATIKRVVARGKVEFSDGATRLSDLVAEASDGFLNGKFTGNVGYKEDLDLNGSFDGEISNLGALDAALPREIPYSNVVNRINLKSRISASSGTYRFTDLSAGLAEGLLNGDFKGRLSFGNESDIAGRLELSGDSLRQIAGSQNISLPPSTDNGAILENFSLSGDVSGTPSTLTFNSGSIALDKLSGAGDFQLSLASNIPSLTGTLSLSPLDIRPYMAAWSAQKPQGKILPWSEEPIVLTGLSALDAKIDVKTPSIQLDRIEIGPTNGIISLEDGTLTADLTDAQLYDGTASGKFSIVSENGTPAIAINAKIDSVAARSFFMASAGFDKVTGKSDLTLFLSGKGDSQADIMRSLTGDGIFDILKGQLLGLDAGMLLSGVDTALTQRQLPEGIGLGKTTDFNDINGKFAIRGGKASLSGFQLKSGNFFIEADGSIDLGDQVIDIGLRPKLSTGSDLAQFGIPLRFTGGFGLAKPSLDTQFLGEIAKAKARAEAGNTVRENIGGSLGNLLGGVIGGQAPGTQPPNETETTEETPPTTNPEASNVADPSKETEAESEAEPADPAETPEEQIGNALKDLFGRKKKD